MGCVQSAMSVFKEERELLKEEERTEHLADLVSAFTERLDSIATELQQKIANLEENSEGFKREAVLAYRRGNSDKALHNMKCFKQTNYIKKREYAKLTMLISSRQSIESSANDYHIFNYVQKGTQVINMYGGRKENFDQLLDELENVADGNQQISMMTNQVLDAFKGMNDTSATMADDIMTEEGDLLAELDKMMAIDDKPQPEVQLLQTEIKAGDFVNSTSSTQARPKKTKEKERRELAALS